LKFEVGLTHKAQTQVNPSFTWWFCCINPPGWGLQLLDIALPKAFDQSIVQTQVGTTGGGFTLNCCRCGWGSELFSNFQKENLGGWIKIGKGKVLPIGIS